MAPAPDFCAEKMALKDAFLNAMARLTGLLSEQSRCMIEDREFESENRLEAARGAVDRAKEAILAHGIAHGC